MLLPRMVVVCSLVSSPRLASLAADALGVQTVRLYHDSVFVKEPGDVCVQWQPPPLILTSPQTHLTGHWFHSARYEDAGPLDARRLPNRIL